MPYVRSRRSTWLPASRSRSRWARKPRRSGGSYSYPAEGVVRPSSFRRALSIRAPPMAELKKNYFGTFVDPATRAIAAVSATPAGLTFPISSIGVGAAPGLDSGLRDGNRIRAGGMRAITCNFKVQYGAAPTNVRILITRSRVPTTSTAVPSNAIFAAPSFPSTSPYARDGSRIWGVLADRVIEVDDNEHRLTNFSVSVNLRDPIEYNDGNSDNIVSGGLYLQIFADGGTPGVTAIGCFQYVEV